MPYGPKLTIKEGDLLKTDSRPEVYLIQSFDRYWIGSGELFSLLGFSWGDIRTVLKSVLETFDYGGAITEDTLDLYYIN